MTAFDGGALAVLFVTNVLNGTVAANGNIVNGGTVVRLLLSIPPSGSPQLTDSTIIASGFPERTDPNALVIGPTGVAFNDSTATLFVADSLNNRIAAVPNALFRNDAVQNGGQTISQGHELIHSVLSSRRTARSSLRTEMTETSSKWIPRPAASRRRWSITQENRRKERARSSACSPSPMAPISSTTPRTPSISFTDHWI